jgi:uncharacterized membrane protein YeaQ/YmgE (transglycosylase-associated protein family)
MSFAIFVGWALAGLLAGVLAGLVVKRGGHGLKADLYLGLAGSIGGSWILRGVGAAPGDGVVLGTLVAFVFAAVLIGAQRKLRPVEQAREERVEEGSGRVVAPARLTGRIMLTNTSRDQTVRLLGGKLRYVDANGQPIKLEDMRSEPTLKFASSASDRLDPGQESSESLEVEFPAAALAATKLKAIHVDLAYIPSPYRQESARFGVAIGAK